MQIVCPCKDCEKRSLRCHSSCTEYKVYKIELETQKLLKEAKKNELQAGQRKYIKNKPVRSFYLDTIKRH